MGDGWDPFEAHSGAASDRLNVAKAQASWNRDLTARIGFSLSGAYAHGFDYRSGLSVTVPGIGTLSPLPVGGFDRFEHGASIGYRFAPNVTVSLFGQGVAGGERRVGRETHGGVALRVGL